MKKLIVLLAFLLVYQGLFGQSPREKVSPNAISARLFFVDYGTPNDLDNLKITNSLEVGYMRHFGRYVSLGVPLKVGVANVAGDRNNRNVVSVDGVLRLQYMPRAQSVVVPYVFGGAGLVSESRGPDHRQFPLGLGINFRLGQNSYLNFQWEYRSASVENRDNMQYGGGYLYQFGKVDRDRDGIADEADACPDIPGVASANGCPDADLDGIPDGQDLCPDVAGLESLGGFPDQDGDGIADGQDPCPEEAGPVNGCPDRDGDQIADRDDDCPDVAGPPEMNGCPDRDGDGIRDADDRCPDEAGEAATGGCPDSDGDGIEDRIDDCPQVAGMAKTRGCPDRDGDGVADADDRCPDVAGPYSGCPDTDGDGLMDADDRCPETPGSISNQGCPEIEEEVQDILNLAMGSVQFETGSASLLQASFGILDQLVQILNEYPDYSMMINGHTDNVGDETRNLTLSEERAKACYDYLVSKGINENRLTYQGFGESAPIGDNNTAVGRLMNRRVEFNMYIE